MLKYVTVISISGCLLFGYLSYSFYGDIVELESKLTDAQSISSSLQHSLENQIQACSIADNKTKELVEELKQEQESLQSNLDKIDKIKPICREKKNNEKDYASLDDELDPNISRVLRESFNSL